MLELQGIGKSFPGVRALHDISVTFQQGEVHALLGENGAGKSTLIKIISGFYQPDHGTVHLDGLPLNLRNFTDGLKHGIAVVNQEIQIVPDVSVAENIMLERLDHYRTPLGLRWKALNQDAARLMALVGLELKPEDRAGGLSAAQKQLTQIAKALAVNAKVLLLDEPTSSITLHEAEKLFTIVRGLRDQGVTVIFVSHKIEEIFALCDKVTVIRDGLMIGTVETKNIKTNDLVAMMIGREYAVKQLGTLAIGEETVLEVNNAYSAGKIHDANFHLKQGEILGFYGLVGAGRTQLARILIGEDPAGTADITIRGKKVKIRSVAEAVYQHRLAYITENRKEEGLILDFSVGTNMAVTIWERFRHSVLRVIDDKRIRQINLKSVEEMSIKTPSLEQLVKNLSGGNQQKVSIAKWLNADCDILIIDEPTVGVDVGAKAQIHDLIWKLASEQGKSIILISSDMPELITLARRILVFRDQRIVGEITGLNEGELSQTEISRQIGQYLA